MRCAMFSASSVTHPSSAKPRLGVLDLGAGPRSPSRCSMRASRAPRAAAPNRPLAREADRRRDRRCAALALRTTSRDRLVGYPHGGKRQRDPAGACGRPRGSRSLPRAPSPRRGRASAAHGLWLKSGPQGQLATTHVTPIPGPKRALFGSVRGSDGSRGPRRAPCCRGGPVGDTAEAWCRVSRGRIPLLRPTGTGMPTACPGRVGARRTRRGGPVSPAEYTPRTRAISPLLRSDFAQSPRAYTPNGDLTDSFVPATEEPFIHRARHAGCRRFELGRVTCTASPRLRLRRPRWPGSIRPPAPR
jgi:hypothetical protein